MQDVIAFGAEHSSLDSAIRRAAERMHIVESRDPMPEQTVFIRSDQYSFVLQGIPAVMPSPGFKSNHPNVKPFDSAMAWMTNICHQPQADMNQPGLDFEAAANFARFTLLTGYDVAQDPQRPTWHKAISSATGTGIRRSDGLAGWAEAGVQDRPACGNLSTWETKTLEAARKRSRRRRRHRKYSLRFTLQRNRRRLPSPRRVRSHRIASFVRGVSFHAYNG